MICKTKNHQNKKGVLKCVVEEKAKIYFLKFSAHNNNFRRKKSLKNKFLIVTSFDLRRHLLLKEIQNFTSFPII